MISSIYVHIPFCASKCGYCSFNSYAGMEGFFDSYEQALLIDIERSGIHASAPPLASVYFGGGTPYYWGVERLERVLSALRERWLLAADAEITLEANPEGVSETGLGRLRGVGFNRISMGAQSFSDICLARVGRRHTAAAIERAVAAAKAAGFENVSLDLMYGLPGQTMGQWVSDLKRAVELAPQHISIYGLTLESPARLWRLVEAGDVELPPDDLQADMYEIATDLLEGAGFSLYELANFAQPGCECRHNINYWLAGEYISVGAGAHSHLCGERYWQESHPHRYVKAIMAGGRGISGSERLAAEERAGDEVILALRLRRGLEVAKFNRRHGRGFLQTRKSQLDDFARQGLIVGDGNRLALTRRGRLLANQVMEAFV